MMIMMMMMMMMVMMMMVIEHVSDAGLIEKTGRHAIEGNAANPKTPGDDLDAGETAGTSLILQQLPLHHYIALGGSPMISGFWQLRTYP